MLHPVRQLLPMLLAAAAACGCAAHAPPRPATVPVPPATTQAGTGKADLALADLPNISLPASRPSTTAPAPLEALELFARARDALARNQRFTAADLLEKALKLDPDSFELNQALGEVSRLGSPWNERAIVAFERAAAIRPQSIELRIQLARQYLGKNDTARATEQLRVAMLCDGYRRADDQGALVDLWLGRVLRHEGYDTAALELFESLLARLRSPSLSLRQSRDPEINFLLARPQDVELQTAQLYEKRGQLAKALAHYEEYSRREIYAWDAQQKIVNLLLALNRNDEAVGRASDLVISHHGESAAVALLANVYQRLGRQDQLIPHLRRLHGQQPTSRALLMALADALTQRGDRGEAVTLLRQSLARRYDLEVLRRLIELHRSAGDLAAAARLLIETSTAHPETVRDLTPLWLDLARFSNKNRLRVATVQKLNLPADLEPARQFWVSRLAMINGRDPLARMALELSAKCTPLFPPAARAQVDQLWLRTDMTDPARVAAAKELADAAANSGHAALAAEITAISLINQMQIKAAADQLAAARKLGSDSPDLQLLEARALIRLGFSSRAEQLLWKLASDHPQYEDAYGLLYQQYDRKPSAQEQVLNHWLKATPRSANGRMLRVLLLVQQDKTGSAEQLLDQLFADESDNAEILTVMASIYRRSGRLKDYLAKLDGELKAHPTNIVAVQQMAAMHVADKRPADAVRVLDAARLASAKDADLLYYIAGLYSQLDQKVTYEQVLEQVLAVDPTHASAANDLGYNWADAGRNLPRAETLIRLAVREEPDNHSYLDSLGWVLYKRGQFAEAHKYLAEAAASSSNPDPVVLDHLGDALYRINRPDDAAIEWRRTLNRLTEIGDDARADLRKLRLEVASKLNQSSDKKPVQTAPAAGELSATQPTTSDSRSSHGRP